MEITMGDTVEETVQETVRETVQKTMKELKSLLDYLIHHNNDHAGEIIVLAEKARDLEMNLVYDDLMCSVQAMNTSNEYLMRALKGLKSE